MIMRDQTLTENSLTLNAFHDLNEFFKSKDHHPSQEMLQGLYNIQDILTKQLMGTADRKYFVSSLEPGVGKTSAIKTWIDNYIKSGSADHYGGVLLCFDRLEEIESFINDSTLPQNCYGVLVGDSTENGKRLNSKGVGHENRNDASVLFTTKQQIILRTLNDNNFNEVSVFYFKGKPRPVRIWDETFISGRSLTIAAAQILELVNTVERKDREIADQLRELGNRLYEFKDNAITSIPDFSVNLQYGFKWTTTGMRKTAETLDSLAGRVAEVRIEGEGRVALDCIESIPEDFMPCLITDASASYRQTYALYQEHNGNLEYLKPDHPLKTYEPLTVRILDRSTGKGTYKNQDEIRKVVKDICAVVTSRPEEPFLIIVTVNSLKDLTRALKDQLSLANFKRVAFLTWGRHTATNMFVDVPNLIVTSLLFYNQSQYIAGMRAAAVFPVSQGNLPAELLPDFKRGEIGHHLLQAINRGATRKCEGNMCPTSRVWIMASTNAVDAEGIVKDVCPKCTVGEWTSVHPVVVKKIKAQVIEYILRETSDYHVLSGAKVRKEFGLTDASNFRKSYLVNPVFSTLLKTKGISVTSVNNKPYFELNPFHAS